MEYKQFCREEYTRLYEEQYSSLQYRDAAKKEREAQKHAIRDATLTALRQFESVEACEIWKAVYSSHLHRKSGLDLSEEAIRHVVSADNSWKKSSGHAFEEIVKSLVNESMTQHGIKVHLQRDISMMIKKKAIANAVRDISWIKEQLKASTFDLYASVIEDGRRFVFGCIQSKTSIRDRVTRDREPSVNAMAAFFWSVAIVLDGDFLRLPKFAEMVNGGGSSYSSNGWHGLHVFSEKYSRDRIYPVNIHLDLFHEHTLRAAKAWLTQRQWMDRHWRADKEPPPTPLATN